MTTAGAASLRSYWITWGALLALTLLMLALDQLSLPRVAVLTMVLAAMLAKATLIAGTFMHLRAERTALVAMIVVGLFLNAAILFALIAPDAVRIAGMRP